MLEKQAKPPAVGGGEAAPGISGGLVVLLAVATGVSVANNYFVQPLLAAVRSAFHTGAAEAGLIVTAAQVGYALGLVFLLPLGDRLERRRLVVVMSLVCAVGLVGMGAAPAMGFLFAAAVLVGATSVVAQILVAFASLLAGEKERGRIVGNVMSGLLLGILLARTAAGYLAGASSWRVVYFVAAGLMVALAAVLEVALPPSPGGSTLSYPAVLSSVVSLFRHEPTLRRRSLYGLLSFAAFSVLWTSLAFLLAGAPYRYGTATIGLFGLVGAAGALMASLAGRLADRGKQVVVTRATALAIAVSFVLVWAFAHDLVALIVGIVVLDLGCQGIHITNQSEIYRLAAEARSRVNAAYMTCYFVGGTVGSVGSAFAYGAFGWKGPCALGVAFGGVAFLVSLGEGRAAGRRTAVVAA